MNLQEFVKETMLQISKGAITAHEELLNLGGMIPDTDIGFSGNQDMSYVYDESQINGQHVQRMIVNVDFDVAITVTESTNDHLGGGLTIASLVSIGAKSENNNITSAINHIKFTLPLVLPKTNSNKVQ